MVHHDAHREEEELVFQMRKQEDAHQEEEELVFRSAKEVGVEARDAPEL
jgi:hypothetical protein